MSSIEAREILVPLCTWKKSEGVVEIDGDVNLQVILSNNPFNTLEAISDEVNNRYLLFIILDFDNFLSYFLLV